MKVNKKLAEQAVVGVNHSDIIARQSRGLQLKNGTLDMTHNWGCVALAA